MNQLSRLAKYYYKASHLPEYLAPDVLGLGQDHGGEFAELLLLGGQ